MILRIAGAAIEKRMEEKPMAMNKVAMNDEEMDQVTGGSILPYSVQSGDTLAKIAKKYNVTLEQLMKWNDIKNPDMITVGQQLKIKF